MSSSAQTAVTPAQAIEKRSNSMKNPTTPGAVEGTGGGGSASTTPRSNSEIHRHMHSSSPSIANASMNAVTSYLKHLLGLNAKPTKRSLSEEAECGSPDSLSEWVRQGSDPNETDAYGYTPLINACLRGSYKAAKILITNGADVNMKAMHGYTPLHAAAQNGFYELIDLLVDQGADMEVRNDDGDTPLMLAVRSDHPEVVDALCKRGCDMHTHGFDNIDPIDYAINKRNLILSDVLMKHERHHTASGAHNASVNTSTTTTSSHDDSSSSANNTSVNSPTVSTTTTQPIIHPHNLSTIKENISLASLIQKEQDVYNTSAADEPQPSQATEAQFTATDESTSNNNKNTNNEQIFLSE